MIVVFITHCDAVRIHFADTHNDHGPNGGEDPKEDCLHQNQNSKGGAKSPV